MALQGLAEIAVLTGIGQGSWNVDLPTIEVATPYGSTSEEIRIAEIHGKAVAFLARRGPNERLQPHKVPYRANIWALASIGVRTLISSTVSIGLNDHFSPGTFVVPDQFIDMTNARESTFFDTGATTQIPTSNPFDPTLRVLAAEVLAGRGLRLRDFGTTAVIEGPRFPTLAECRWFAASGADLYNMTLMPETTLAIEAGMAVVNISFITNQDGTNGDQRDENSLERIRLRVSQVQPNLRKALFDLIQNIPPGFHGSDTEPTELDQILAKPVA